MNLVLLEPGEVEDQTVTLADARAAHILNVLRVTSGQRVRVGVVDGPLGIGTVTGIAGTSVQLRCTFDDAVPEPPRVDLLLALPRPKVLRRLWAQLAAVGVRRIMVTNAERVERNYFDTHVLSPAVYRPLLIEGLQQARDTRLPIVSIHRQFRILIEDDVDPLCGPATRLVADPRASASLRNVVAAQACDRVVLAVGPEGGWNDFELALLASHGFIGAGMGPRTLRTDTACIALLSLLHDALAPE